MENTTKYTGVDAFIIAYAVKFTNIINNKLNLCGREDEDIFQELVISGCASQRMYRKELYRKKLLFTEAWSVAP